MGGVWWIGPGGMNNFLNACVALKGNNDNTFKTPLNCCSFLLPNLLAKNFQ